MKVLVVGSPHSASTRDVWIGCMKGLAAHGVGIQSYDMLPRGEFFSTLVDFVNEKKIPIPQLKGIPGPMVLAYEAVFAAAHWHEVDTVFFISPQYLPMEIPDLLRKDGFRVWAYMTEAPYEDPIDAPQKAAHFDWVFLNDLNSEGYWQAFNPHSAYIPHSYDPDKHFPWWAAPAGKKRHDIRNGHQHVVYVGSGFGRRQQYLEDVDWTGIDLRVYGHWPLIKPLTDERERERYAPIAREGVSPLLPFVIPKMVENSFTARLYRGAAIGINMHRLERWANNDKMMIDEGEAYSMGPRGVELAACGAFQVSDPRQEVIDVFGDSVPLHRNPADLERLIRKYLNDPAERDRLARQQHEAIKGRTFANHMRRVLELAA